MISSLPQPVSPAVLLSAGTATSFVSIAGSTNVVASNYLCVNTGASAAWLNFSPVTGPVAAFPTAGVSQPGLCVPAGGSLLISGPGCGNGKTAYVAGIAAAATTVYITPMS